MEKDDRRAAIAELATQLQGAIAWEVDSGGTSLPRPRLPTVVDVAKATKQGVAAGTRVEPSASMQPNTLSVQTDDAPTPSIQIDVDKSIAKLVASSGDNRLSLLEREVLGPCTRCKLHRGRSNIVFGIGSETADIVFVGEGPGAHEDRQGIPFVGKAGMLLTKMIEAMGTSREAVYICNVVKCRPPNNRDPHPEELAACERFLRAQLAIIKPQVIVTLGRFAAHALLKTKRPIGHLRGTWHSYAGVDLMPTWHPAYLLREPAKKRETWEDLKLVMERQRR